VKSAKHILLLGPPASGKGTQGKRLAKMLQLPVLGTGNVLRQAIEDQTELGIEAETYINSGLYVPDALIESIVEQWAKQHAEGWIFDGFPRTQSQADFIQENTNIASPSLVIGFKVSEGELEKRINSRRQCRKCDLVTSTYAHQGAICPEPSCDGEIYARNDDAIESFRVRYSQYENLTAPLFDYYREQGILVELDGELPLEEVFDSVKKAVQTFSEGVN